MPVFERTPCASAVLNFFGVQGATWNERTQRNIWPGALRRNGFSVRSRMSALGKCSTVGKARKKIKEIADGDAGIIAFIATVDGHVLVIDRNGKTTVDTNPKARDQRKLFAFAAVWAK